MKKSDGNKTKTSAKTNVTFYILILYGTWNVTVEHLQSGPHEDVAAAFGRRSLASVRIPSPT